MALATDAQETFHSALQKAFRFFLPSIFRCMRLQLKAVCNGYPSSNIVEVL